MDGAYSSQNDWKTSSYLRSITMGRILEEGSTGWLRLRLLYSLLVAADRIEATSANSLVAKTYPEL